MEDFIVSARKYRPMTFDSVVGQHALTTTLKNAIANGKLAHAYLFCGPRGVGKTTCARIFAKAINCLNPNSEGDACGECESCLAFNQGRSLNIHELDAASNNSVEDIRELITQVQIPPQTGRYKVFIIDEVHMLSASAFNAFLKTLEEPPSYVIFILATTEKHKILPTILSRCQVYDFVRITSEDTISHLRAVAQKEGYNAEDEALNLIAQKADGGMRDALSIFDQMASFTGGNLTYEAVCQNLNVLSTEHYFNMTEQILNRDVKQCLLSFDTILQKGFDGGIFIGGLASHMRDLLVSRDAQTLRLLEKGKQRQERYAEQAQKCRPTFLYRAIKLCNDCETSYRTSRNKRLCVEICLIQLVQAIDETDCTSGGRSPERKLKPVFEATEQTASSAVAEPTPELRAPAPQTPPSVVAPTQPQPRTMQQSAPKPRVMNGFGPSLRIQKNEQTQNGGTQKQESAQQAEHTPLDTEKFRIAWYEFIQSLPRESQAMAQRMRDMRPEVTDADTVRIEVNNVQVAQYMHNTIIPPLLSIVRKTLKNDFINIKIDIQEVQQAARKYSKAELFTRMTQINPALNLMKDVLELSIE
ncbi:MAG: DNA polymerase III subunit gamma/tau [Bacteroidaceae bacterium]|nr:DNA polymerase III subunit gamma/tau [Bacteroidaceae bacterium]